MMLMLIAAVFVHVFLANGLAKSVSRVHDNVSAMEQLMAMVPERTTDNLLWKEMYQQQQKQLKLLEKRIERIEQCDGPYGYGTTVKVNTSEVGAGSQENYKLGRVFFTALKQTPQTNIGQHQRITFENVILNVGNCYRKRNGIFIAPMSGIYLFSVTLATQGYSYAALVHTEGEIARIYSYQSYSSGTITVVVHLTVHEHVWVENKVHSGRYVFGELYSAFTGILLA